jgi:hypothetical protein
MAIERKFLDIDGCTSLHDASHDRADETKIKVPNMRNIFVSQFCDVSKQNTIQQMIKVLRLTDVNQANASSVG